MKKTYTKKQITEAIAYWKKQLKLMNESIDICIQNTVDPAKADAIIVIVPKNNVRYDNIEIYPVNQDSLDFCMTMLKDDYPDSNIDSYQSVMDSEYPDCIFSTEIDGAIIKIIPTSSMDNKVENISQSRVNEIGEQLEDTLYQAFEDAAKRHKSIVPGDPKIDKSNKDTLRQELLDELFGGARPNSKNRSPYELWSIYDEYMPCGQDEFVQFYKYVKENGY